MGESAHTKERGVPVLRPRAPLLESSAGEKAKGEGALAAGAKGTRGSTAERVYVSACVQSSYDGLRTCEVQTLLNATKANVWTSKAYGRSCAPKRKPRPRERMS